MLCHPGRFSRRQKPCLHWTRPSFAMRCHVRQLPDAMTPKPAAYARLERPTAILASRDSKSSLPVWHSDATARSHVLDLSRMGIAIDELWDMPERALVSAYAEARRQFVAKKFVRDTDKARLEWMK